MLKNIFVNVTNSSTAFSVQASSSMADFKVGDLLAVRDNARGTILMEVMTKNDAARTGTFTNGYIGATASNLFAPVVTVSTIDPTGDTVIKTKLIQQITEAFARDEAQSAIWMQLLTVPSGNVTITLPDGNQITGPSWRGITGEMVSQTATAAQAIKSALSVAGTVTVGTTATPANTTLNGELTVGKDFRCNGTTASIGGTTSPTNLDVYGYALVRKGLTVNEDVNAKKGIISDGNDNEDFPRMACTRHYTTADGRMYTGGSFLARLEVGKGLGAPRNITTQFNMQLRHLPGQDESGFIAYQATNGNWYETRWLRDGNVQNISGQFIGTSDRRMKTKITEVEDPIALIRGLKLYTYDKDGQPGIGCIAQEVEKQIPLVVTTGGSVTLHTTGETITNLKGVDYSTLGYIALTALDKAIDRIEALEAKVQELELIKARLDALEGK
ncbi:putative tail fiber protein [Serratia phage vB_SmaM-Susuwatari]|nr:putative tail fiber protein [Serratia phage vB_SmaM-Susuwatari]